MPEGNRPTFWISDAAKAAKRSEEGIRYAESVHTIPNANRNHANRRVYSLRDLMQLQLIMNREIDSQVLASILHDKGYDNLKQVNKLLSQALGEIKASQQS